ncbi:hypothetical protein [Falsiroseomonas sp. E2-1-a4]|uniref:hypothetical protein n=1 Tax=Falsiroseomonas sp. E2-1-a4 TaxID=3239299 RepID=UPI003F3E68C6
MKKMRDSRATRRGNQAEFGAPAGALVVGRGGRIVKHTANDAMAKIERPETAYLHNPRAQTAPKMQ